MLLPWAMNYVFAAEAITAPGAKAVSHTFIYSCYDDPSSLFYMADLGIELTLFAIVAMTIIHLARNILKRRIAVPRTADSLATAIRSIVPASDPA